MSVAIMHPSIEIFGGAERVMLCTVEILRDVASHTDIYVSARGGRISLELLTKLHMQHAKLNILRLPTCFPSSAAILTNYLNFLINNLSDKYKIIIDNGALYIPFMYGDICYIHFPIFYQHILEIPGTKYRAYGNLLIFMSKALLSKAKCNFALFNSNFTMEITLHVLNELNLDHLIRILENAYKKVVYPPVDTEIITKYAKRNINKIIHLSI